MCHPILRQNVNTKDFRGGDAALTPPQLKHTGIAEYPPFRPMFDDHSQRPHTLVYLNVGPNHTRIVQCQCVVHVHIAG